MWGTPSISFYGLLSVGLLTGSGAGGGGNGSGAVERVIRRHRQPVDRKTYVYNIINVVRRSHTSLNTGDKTVHEGVRPKPSPLTKIISIIYHFYR